eukprot:scaffold1945_cov395-Prasinococcus_capsulatus_cf.AAC.3
MPVCLPAIRDANAPVTLDEPLQKDSYQALERKAALYDKLARGHAEDDEETYNVDFFRKGSSLAEEEATLDGERQQYHYAGATTYQERNAGSGYRFAIWPSSPFAKVC